MEFGEAAVGEAGAGEGAVGEAVDDDLDGAGRVCHRVVVAGVVDEHRVDQFDQVGAGAAADRTGLYVCPHTAVALACTKKLREAGTIEAGESVVVVSTASGLKFTEFKVRYHEAAIDGVDSQQANPPIELPADYGDVLKAITG